MNSPHGNVPKPLVFLVHFGLTLLCKNPIDKPTDDVTKTFNHFNHFPVDPPSAKREQALFRATPDYQRAFHGQSPHIWVVFPQPSWVEPISSVTLSKTRCKNISTPKHITDSPSLQSLCPPGQARGSNAQSRKDQHKANGQCRPAPASTSQPAPEVTNTRETAQTEKQQAVQPSLAWAAGHKYSRNRTNRNTADLMVSPFAATCSCTFRSLVVA